MNSDLVLLGRTYLHLSGGFKYKTTSVVLNATGYEKIHDVVEMIEYEQLDAGVYPVGQVWVREKEDFLSNFKLLEDE